MKKTFGVVLFLLFAVVIVEAQNTTFGVKAGLNVSKVNIEDGEDYDSKTGLHLGGLAHIHISRNWAFQPELVFSMQGGEDDGNDDLKLKLNYLNIPLLIQYMTHDGFRFQTGPQIGFLLSAKSESGDVEVDIKDQMETAELSWTFGVGYLFPRANGLGVDLRYNLGISNIVEDDDIEARNRVFQIGVFYQFMNRGGKRR